MDLKWVSLATLVIQNSSLVLVMRYSRTISNSHYLASTAVVMAEFLKLCLSVLLYAHEMQTAKKHLSASVLWEEIFGETSNWKLMTVPAILYFIQNNLQYHAVSMVNKYYFITHRKLFNVIWVF